ncbi:MAG: transcriptional regulator [Spirochaetae bacterium HGW-Spirochaetae-3]|jgi:DNA-binding transcriptional ArsR family regulator|nr:MAG: transcriptional regulator [Spirochaetae bacterium HGW-Spirochaetae-3]
METEGPDATAAYGAVLSLDPKNLKGLAHPLRLRLLGALREFGPATSSMLARRLGESSGATSYHLRQLASFGFIEEDPRPSKKERWWRASHGSTYFDERSIGEDLESGLLGAEFLRSIAGAHATRMAGWIGGLPDSSGDWRYAGTISDWGLRLTPAELKRLQAELEAVVARYARFDPEEPAVPGTTMVAAQIQLLPRFPEQGNGDGKGRAVC